jgi:hypothetical protein
MTRSRAGLWALAALLMLLGAGSPMLLIFPMWIVTYLQRQRLARAVARVPRDLGFVAAAVCFGLLTEAFAVLTNLSRPPAERILLDPDPSRDLLMALAYYSAVATTWWWLLRRWRFSQRDVFLTTGLFGIVVEETGLVLLRIVTWPILGAIYAVYVAFVYGLFPMLALMVCGGEPVRGERPPAPGAGARAAAFGALMLQYLVMGGLVFPILRRVV